jgi:hypothetical protein
MHKIDSLKKWTIVAALTGCAVAANTTGCGGSNSTSTGGSDSGVEEDATSDGSTDSGSSSGGGDSATDTGSGSGGQDSGSSSGGQDSGMLADSGSSSGGQDSGTPTDSGSSSGGQDSGVDAATGCTGTDTACVNPSTGSNDFCVNSACNACTDVSDDPNCVTAYGSGTICVGGACVPGNCHSDTNCPTGQICGVVTPNTCGGCTDDLQCQDDSTYGPGFVCNTTTSLCVASACGTTATGNANSACTANPADFCCAGLSLSDTCVPGNCCTSLQCPANYSCIGNTCTQCAAATGNTYYVDPSNGKSSGSTGAQSCPFKTITQALEFIGGNAALGTLIEVVDADPVSNGETFPIVVPGNVTIETVTTAAAPVTISVGAGKIGFALGAGASGLSNLVIDGSTNTATTGIAAYGGSSATTTTVKSVTVQNFAGSGVLVGTKDKASTAGAVSLGPSLNVTGNGTTAKPAPGIWISSGTASITGSAGAGTTGHTSIHGNTQHGILVTGPGYVQILAGASQPTASAAGVAYVDLDDNHIAGLFIAQTPSNSLQTNTVQDVEIVGTIAGNGIHVEGGSQLTLSGSYVAGSANSGIDVSPYGTGASANNSVAGINLGTIALAGKNTLQGAGSAANSYAGICLRLPNTAAQTLNAAGNIFGTINCGASTSALSHTAGCTAGAQTDVGGIGGTANTNAITVSGCTD